MKRILLTLLLACIFTLPVSARSWNSIIKDVTPSIVRVATPNEDGSEGICTGFSINKAAGYFITARHCVSADGSVTPTVNGYATTLLYLNDPLDVVVLGSALHLPALHQGKNPELAQDVATYGFAYGSKEALFRTGHVAHPGLLVPGAGPGLWFLLDVPYIGGMSGGPVFNQDGKVVGIVQRTNDKTGLGRIMVDVAHASYGFWER